MRVYEFSKKFNVVNKDVLAALKKGGFEVGSHMAVLTDDALAFLNKTFNSSSQALKAEKKPAAKKQLSQPREKKPMQQQEPAPSQRAAQPVAQPEKLFEIRAMSVGQASLGLQVPLSDLILTLLKWGVVAAKNQMLTEDVVGRLAEHYEIESVRPVAAGTQEMAAISVDGGDLQERLPVVVVLGHVDHGKTTLLDFIRKTRVASREKGGITQHLGAYQASTDHGSVIFIDTPGHEAFSKMRMRGVKVADIAVIVVAADDSIMPQTKEAIAHAKAMNVPVVVAINKIDRVDSARIEAVKQDLVKNDLLPEEWGGDVAVAPISAKEGTGIDQLLEILILQSQLLELQADVAGPGKGYVLESRLEKGRGPVATILCQHGKAKVGDYFACGKTVGKISSMVNSSGKRVKSVGPSVPVRIAGFSALPEAGDYFEVVSKVEYLKLRSSSSERLAPRNLFIKEDALNLIIKTDTNSSKEALLGSIEKISKKFKRKLNIIHAGVGDVSESDVVLAATTKSQIFTLHVKPESNAATLAQKQGVDIFEHGIIYKLLEQLQEIIEGAQEIEMVRTKIGEAVVRRVFDIKQLGVIAGCYVKDGRFTRNGSVVVWRGTHKIGEGPIKSLQRDKKSVKEVHSGYECGFLVDGLTDLAVDDRVECFIQVPKQPKK